MKITQSKYFYYALSMLFMGLIFFLAYYQLGGLKEIEVTPYDDVDYSIAGVEFKGQRNDPQIEVLFNEVKVATEDIQGTLCLMEYFDAETTKEEVLYFIGIILDNRVTELPGNYSVRRIKSRALLRATLDVHPLVRPAKEEIEAKMYQVAAENGFEIENFFLEKHFADDRLEIEGFVK